MTADKYVEYILTEYEITSQETLSEIARASHIENITSGISQADLQSSVTRKLAALITHRAMQRLTQEADEDWGFAKGFRDIYDCRVCANAIAQVAVKGIIPPETDTLFGLKDTLSDGEIKETVTRFFCASKRITKLLES